MTVEVIKRSHSGQWLGPGRLSIETPGNRPDGPFVEVPFTAALVDEPWLPCAVEVVVEAWSNWKDRKRWQPFVAQLRLFAQPDEDGRPVPITPSLLRDVPVGRVLREALAAWEVYETNPITGRTLKPVSLKDADAMATPPPRRRPGRGVSDDELRRVAKIYRQAVAEGERAPVRAVQRSMHLARSTAGRLVMEARRRTDPETGETFLGPATGTVGGEA
jgi:hypothetical protein